MQHLNIRRIHLIFTSVLITGSFLLVIACSPSEDQSAKTVTEPAADKVTEPAPAVKQTDIPITSTSQTAKALYAAGQYLVDVGRGVQAREKFRAASNEDPKFALAYYGQSNAALSFAEFQQSLDAATEYSEGISEGERLLIDINKTFASNDAATGLALAEELVEKYPESARAWMILATMQSNQNDNTGARASLEKALGLEDQAAGALAGLANNYLFGEPRDFEMAEEWAARFISAYPDEAKGFEIMGDIKRAQNDLKMALEAYNSASSIDPTLELAAHKRGHVNSFLGNIENARTAYDEAIAIAPAESKAAYAVYKGFTNIHGGDIPAAIDELEAIVYQVEPLGTPQDQIKGAKVFALSSAAFAAMHAGYYEQAKSIVERRNLLQMSIAEDVGTDDARRLQEANCHLFDGLLAAYQSQTKNANEHASAIASLVGDDEDPRKLEPAHWIYGMSALQLGDYSGAAEHLRKADYANNMFVRYQLALAEEGLGNSEEAKKLFADVASFNFNSVGFALTRSDAATRAN